MIDPFSAMLVGQAIKLLAVPAGEAWSEFAKRLGGRFGGATADVVTDWLTRGGRDSGLTDRDVLEMRGNDPASTALKHGLEHELGIRFGANDAGSGYQNPDTLIVAGYEAVLWRIAALAYVENRPVVVDGALQGPDWLTLCIPTPNMTHKKGSLPDPEGIWWRFDAPAPRISRPTLALADFYSLAPAADGRSKLRNELNQRFRRERDAIKAPEGPGSSITDHWHLIQAAESTWVQLEPDIDALREVVARSSDPSSVRLGDLRHDWYPEAWYPLIDIPDEIESIKALSRGADEFAAKSASLKERLSAILPAT